VSRRQVHSSSDYTGVHHFLKPGQTWFAFAAGEQRPFGLVFASDLTMHDGGKNGCERWRQGQNQLAVRQTEC